MRRRSSSTGTGEDGYILLTLLLIIALIIIATAAIVPSITFEIKRDREEEMIHRGVQYSRAIRAYYKKFGRYPTKIEDLENTNNLRFLRKRYKDPMNCTPQCQDFKLLHFGEVKLTFSGGIGGGGINGATSLNNPTPFGPQIQPSGANPGGSLGNAGTGFGGTQSSFGQSSFGANSSSPPGSNTNPPPDQSQNANTDATGQTPDQQSPGQPPSGQQTPGQAQPGSTTGGDQLSNTTFGGGPIVGVVSANKKDTTIREFNHKKKYNEWQFIYDPGTDRGGLLMTPNQPPLQGFGQGIQNVNGQNGTTQTPTGNGFGNTFGLSPSGTQQNNTTAPVSGNPPANDSNNPPQQQ